MRDNLRDGPLPRCRGFSPNIRRDRTEDGIELGPTAVQVANKSGYVVQDGPRVGFGIAGYCWVLVEREPTRRLKSAGNPQNRCLPEVRAKDLQAYGQTGRGLTAGHGNARNTGQ